jgi:hypothetical protein
LSSGISCIFYPVLHRRDAAKQPLQAIAGVPEPKRLCETVALMKADYQKLTAMVKESGMTAP